MNQQTVLLRCVSPFQVGTCTTVEAAGTDWSSPTPLKGQMCTTCAVSACECNNKQVRNKGPWADLLEVAADLCWFWPSNAYQHGLRGPTKSGL